MSRTATSGRAPRDTTSRPRADHCGVERDRAARCPWPTGLSAPLSAAAAPLIGGGKLPFLALGLFSLAVLAPAPDRLGAASHGDERNNLLDHLHAPTRGLEPHQTARCSVAAVISRSIGRASKVEASRALPSPSQRRPAVPRGLRARGPAREPGRRLDPRSLAVRLGRGRHRFAPASRGSVG
jgi:hypothetical protein